MSTSKKPIKASAKKSATAKKLIPLPAPKPSRKVMFIDSTFFFPFESSTGYTDHFQDGRCTKIANNALLAPIMLPVKSVIKSITIYYKNTTKEDMQVMVVKKHIDHHAYSGEVEVSIDSCPPGVLAPDNYLAKLIDHFDAGGLIKPNYLYYIEIGNTIRKNEATVRSVRGMRIEYTLP